MSDRSRREAPIRSYEVKGGRRYKFVVDIQPLGMPRQQIRRSGFRTKAEAIEARQAYLEEQGQVVVAPTRLTFGPFMQEWLKTHSRNLRPTTAARYRRDIENFIMR